MRVVVYPKTALAQLPLAATALHLARPLAAKKLAVFLERRGIERVSCSESTFRRLKKKHLDLLKEKGISLEIEKRQGRAIGIDLKKLQQMLDLVHDHRSLRQIEKETGIPKSTVHYLVKYADRGKIRSGNKLIYLK